MTTTHDASTRPHLEARYAAAVEAEREADAEATRLARQRPIDVAAFRAAERRRHDAKRAKNRLAKQLKRMNETNWGCNT